MNIYFGCPIWSFRGWVGNFYPKGTKPSDFMREYARRLTAVEGNTTFYAVPAQKTIEQWVAETPESFRFCPKIPRNISHDGKLFGHIEEARQFIEIMRQLGPRLGPMFLQLPPNYSPRMFDDLKAFLDAWPLEAQLGVEVRHHDWFEAEQHHRLNELLAHYQAARVLIDTRPIRKLERDKLLEGSVYQALLQARHQKPDVPILPERTAGFIFLRYIGHPQMEVNQPFIGEWVEYLAAQLREGAEAYVFCHTPDNVNAPLICREIHLRLSEILPVPPLPWDQTGGDTLEQGRLF
jgi:uncharacterized protein YecE (DUF72 family)